MVGITHVRRGNVEGAIALLRRASARPAHYELAAPYAVTSQVWSIRRRADLRRRCGRRDPADDFAPVWLSSAQ